MLEHIFKHKIGDRVTVFDENGDAHIVLVVGHYGLEIADQPPLYRYVLRSPQGTAMIDIREVEDQL